MQYLSSGLKNFVPLLILLFAQSAFAAWTSPTSIPPSDNMPPPIFASSTLLQIIGNSGNGGQLRLLNSSGSNSAELQLQSSVNGVNFWSVYSKQTGDGAGSLNFKFSSGDDIFTIDDNGRVGIGTTTPSEKFSVDGKIYSTSGFVLPDGTLINTAASLGGGGTVTSVGMSVPAGLLVSPSSITTSGTFALTLDTLYNIPLTASTTNWNDAFNWGDHSTAGYLTTVSSSTLNITAVPVDGQLLTASSTATGGLVWAAAPNGSQWTTTGLDIYYNTGNIGIGTTTPNKLLHLYNTNQSAEIDLQTRAGENKHFGIYVATSTAETDDTLRFWAPGGSDALVVKQDGNIGIGTTTPNSLLSIASSTASGTSKLFSVASSTELLTVLANGNVGIGTTTPQLTLDVNGLIRPGMYSATTTMPTCSSDILGAFAFNTANNRPYFCDSTSWLALGVRGEAAATFGLGSFDSDLNTFGP